MRVLWFTNIPLPAMMGYTNQGHVASGGWMIALLEQLLQVPDIELAVSCVAPGLKEAEIVAAENLRFYPIARGPAWRPFAFTNPDTNPRYLAACAKVVHKVNPDIIHIHGSERFYGLLGARQLTLAPVVISLQGLLHEYVRPRHYFGVTTLRDIIATHDLFHLARWMGPLPAYFQVRRAAQRELEILRGNCWFMGRTDWDRTHLRAVNPKARYFDVPELLRAAFYESSWSLETAQRHRIIFTNADSFHRGVEVLLDALALLKREFSDISLALCGGVEQLPYGKRLQKRIAKLGLQDVVEFLGRVNEIEMAAELKKAHVFVITSLLENSPNSLCEAQLVGLPCIASYVGGIPSLLEEGKTGLFFPPGDAAVLAERIREVFADDYKARALGDQARRIALKRHDRATVTQSVIETYRTIIQADRNPVSFKADS